MANKIGPLIKQARTDAGFTQEQLAKKVEGLSASELSKAERGELELTQTTLKQIAKATGVTQSSLINAAKESTYKKATAASKKKSTATKSTSASSSGTSMKVTAAEKKLVELYRDANSETKKKVVSILKGESTGTEDILGTLITGAMDMLGKK